MTVPEYVVPPDMGDGLAIPASQAKRIRKLLAARASRKIEGLVLYEPLPLQAEFHASTARTNLIRGSNRSGKTLSASAEVARAATGQDPHGKYPLTNGRCFCVGKDLKHVGEVMWRKLSRPDQFRMIRDEVTKRWRAYRPWDLADLRRLSETKPAAPLIPPRLIKSIAWLNKKAGIPSKVVLKNGWELSFYSSEGKPPRGSDIDLWWFDEEIIDRDWYPEMSARVLDRRGRGIWSATPESGTEQLYDLHERAYKERHSANPSVREFIALLAENPHITEEAKRGLAADLTEEQKRVKIDGQFAFTHYLVYPEFSRLRHVVEPFPVPNDWTRYMVVDPGHSVCAVLFAAVPPKGEEIYLYDELYIQDCDAAKFAIAVAEKTRHQAVELALIDPNMGMQTEISSGKTVGQQYSYALGIQGFSADVTGTGFLPANDDVTAGILAVHGLLRDDPETGRPRLRIFDNYCANLVEEFKRYVKKKVDGVITDKPNPRKASHLMDCTRYLALYEPRYVKPRPRKAQVSRAVQAVRSKQKRAGGRGVNLGPGR